MNNGARSGGYSPGGAVPRRLEDFEGIGQPEPRNRMSSADRFRSGLICYQTPSAPHQCWTSELRRELLLEQEGRTCPTPGQGSNAANMVQLERSAGPSMCAILYEVKG